MSNYKTDWAEYDGWKPEDVQIHKDTDWGKRNYEELVVPEDNFEGEAVLYTLDGKYVEPVKFVKHIRPNPIYPPYYAPEENPFKVSHVGFMYDGTSHDGYDVHDRAESQEVYDMLSEKLYSEEDDEQDTWEFLKSKSVQDFDGFYTDYSMYFNHDTGTYGFVLGDNEIYGPENTELDWEESQLSNAEEWFDSYTGYEDYEDYSDGIEESKETESEESLVEDETKDKIFTEEEGRIRQSVKDLKREIYTDYLQLSKDGSKLLKFLGGTFDVVIPDGVTSISSQAFPKRTAHVVQRLSIPDSCIDVPSYTFSNLVNLKEANFPENINIRAFYGSGIWESIKDAYRDDSGLVIVNNEVISYDNRASKVVIPDGITSIGNNAFYVCTSLTNITIPDSVTSIGRAAFSGCSSLTSINIPDSVKSIGDYAFSDCNSLKSLNIPNGVRSISDYAFRGCSSLTSVTIPDSVTSIGYYAFSGCKRLTNITIPDSVESIGYCAFMNTPVEEKLQKSDLQESMEKVFTKEERIRLFGEDPEGEVVIPGGYTSIGDSAFYGCESLKRITIPDSVTSIGEWSFRNCESLKRITIPDSVTSIGDQAVLGCKSLTSIIIPDSVTSIGSNAFSNCTALTQIKIPDSVIWIGGGAFDFCKSLTSITIPNSVTSIGNYAFYNCPSLKSVTIPNSVTSIGEYAFESCTSLESITIPNSVTSIGDKAFYFCESLTRVTMPDGVKLGKDVFKYTPLESQYQPKMSTWQDVVQSLKQDLEKGISDPLYSSSDAGQYITDLCTDVESDIGVGLEPSVQGGRGGIKVYDADDHCIANNIDYQTFNKDTIDLVLEAESEEDFKSSYSAFLENTIDSNACYDENLSEKICESATSNMNLPLLYDYKIKDLGNLYWSNDEVSNELAQKIKDLAKLLDETYNLYQEQIAKPKAEAKKKSEEERISKTGLTIPLTQAQADLCSAVLGQLSDGYWENNSYYDPFWKNIDVKGTNLVIDMESLRYAKWGDRFKKDVEELSTPEGAKRWFAKKAQIVQNEDLKYEFGTTRIKGHEDEQANYLDRGVNQTFGQVQAAIDSMK